MTEIYRPVLRSKITTHLDQYGYVQRFRILYLSCGHWAMTERTNHKRPKQVRCRTCEIAQVGIRRLGLRQLPASHQQRSATLTEKATARALKDCNAMRYDSIFNIEQREGRPTRSGMSDRG